MARNALYPPSVKPGIPRLGAKPKGWIETTFGDVLHVIQRPAKIKDNVKYQLVTAKRGRGGIVPRETLTGKKILTKTQYFIAKDDFLISKRQIVHGACGIVPSTLDGALVSGEYSVLRVKDGLLLKYLDYFSYTDYFQMSCFQASVGVDVEKMIFDLKDWLKFKIYLPPISEQQKIINLLNTWSKSVKLTEQLILAKRQLKTGLTRSLFAKRDRFPEFKKTNTWNSIPLEKIVVPKEGIRRGPFGGALKKTMFTKEGYKVYQQGNVIQKDWSLGDYFVNEAKFCEMKSFQVLPGDFLVSCSGTIGKIIKVPDNVQPGIINQALLRIRINSQVVESSFFYHQFESEQIQKSILKNTHGGAMQNLVGMDIFRRIEFRVPSIPEQRRIASIIQSCEDEIDILSKKYSALMQQKKGLMQKLLTGQMRVEV